MNPDSYTPSPADLYFHLLMDASKQGMLTSDENVQHTVRNIEQAVTSYKEYVSKLS